MTGDQSGTDEIFMAAQEAVGAATGQQQRDSQGSKKFLCVYCGKTFIADHSLRLHFQFHCTYGPRSKDLHPDDPRTCFQCKTSFRTDSALSHHLIRICQTEKPYHCKMCNYRCKWDCEFQKHMSKKHADLMEVLHSVLETVNQENQLETGVNEQQAVTENENMEAGLEEDQPDLPTNLLLKASHEENQFPENEETQLEPGNLDSFYGAENIIDTDPDDQVEDEDKEEQTETENKENLCKSVFKKRVKSKKNLEKNKNNNRHKTVKRTKKKKEKKREKHKHRRDKERGSRKRKQKEKKQNRENGECSQRNNVELNHENEDEGADDSTVNLSLDRWLEGLPRMSNEEFERLTASETIFQI